MQTRIVVRREEFIAQPCFSSGFETVRAHYNDGRQAVLSQFVAAYETAGVKNRPRTTEMARESVHPMAQTTTARAVLL